MKSLLVGIFVEGGHELMVLVNDTTLVSVGFV